MDIQAYIQSGVIESYVLGLTSADETAEVERLRLQHPAVEEAINEFSTLIEEKAFQNAVVPPPDVKARVLAAIQDEKNVVKKQGLSIAHQDGDVPMVLLSSMRNWRIAAAASIILFVVSAAFNYYLYDQYSNKKEAYQALLFERQSLQASNDVYQTQLKEWQSAAAMIADPAMAMVKMKSTKGKDHAATVFWNTQNKDVYVMVNRLPEARRGRQYQLWAMVDGKPVDAGLLDGDCTSVCKMKNIPKAQAFAITLEKEGGSPTPHLNALLVMGTI